MPKIDATAEPGRYRRLFEDLGVSFPPGGGDQVQARECPFCGGTKFRANVTTGMWNCLSLNKCGEKGNALTFVREYHSRCFAATRDADYDRFRAKYDVSLQLVKAVGVAWDAAFRRYLIPAKAPGGNVSNLLKFDPAATKGLDKLLLSGLPMPLYGLEGLPAEADRAGKVLYVCEGFGDYLMVLSQMKKNKTLSRYVVIAVHSAGTFRPEWTKFLTGFKEVRVCFDADKAGRDGQDKVARVVREQKAAVKLVALKWPAGTPEKTDLGDLVRDNVSVAEFTGKHCVSVAAPTARLAFVRGDQIGAEKTEWLWDGHIPFGTLVSLSGAMGTAKSTILKDVVARGTAGAAMPHCTAAVPPFGVLYFTSEDPAAQVRDLVRVHGGDLARLYVHDIASTDDPADLLDCLAEVEATINGTGARLVVLDALNSFVTGDISTDTKARRSLTGKLQHLARRTGACVVAVRNWAKGADGAGTGSQKSLGASSVADVARCVLNTAEEKRDDEREPRRFRLEFEKVSGAPRPDPIAFEIKDMSTGLHDRHLRRIVWPPPIKVVAANFKASLDARRARAAS
jgi:hypothetical protein